MFSRAARFSLLAALLCAPTAPCLHAQTDGMPSPQTATDAEVPQTERQWVRSIREALVAERFDALEAMAAKYRGGERVVGGDWRLHLFYVALNSPHAGDTSVPEHLLHLQHWIAARPQSIAAATAYAGSMHRWAWQARGNGETNTVTEEGWRLFKERIAEGRRALDVVGTVKGPATVADPQWYSEYMVEALAQDWENADMKALFDRASQAFPAYFYLDKQYASYLLPKWDGEPGDAAAFAKRAADAQPGPAGDMLYFQVGTLLLSRSNGSFPARTLDWPRLQRGYAALTAQYGGTPRLQNEFALMAYRERDAAVAQQQFRALGDGWSHAVWRDGIHYQRARDWAAAHAGTSASNDKGLIPLGP